MGRDASEMKPHEDVDDPQSEDCASCPQNAWGSGEGKGKACKNGRRMMVVPAGTWTGSEWKLFSTAEEFTNLEMALIKVPVMSVKGYSGYVQKLTNVLKRPPFAVITEIAVVPDAKSQFKLTFSTLAEIDGELVMNNIMPMHEEAKASIIFPYPKREGQPEVKSKPSGRKKF